MAVVGLFYGSDTGNTENIAKMIQKQLGNELVDIRDIAKSSKEDIEGYDFLLFGIPTWYYGEAQADCDQEDYADYFCDAIGTVRDIVEPRGAIIVGNWPTDGYTFESSKALLDDGNFIGLCIDEDRQPELTAERVEKWTKQIYDEMCLAELA